MQVDSRREPAHERGWQRFGACRGEDPELFFPEGPDPRSGELQAVAVCMACPVLGACQWDALASREMFGVWGGLTESERRLMFAARARLARVGSAA